MFDVHQRAGVLITHWLRKPYSNQREQENDDNLAQRSKDADELGNEDQDQQGKQHFEDEDDQKEQDDDDEEL